MRIRGYKKKGKPAIWQAAFPDQAAKLSGPEKSDNLFGFNIRKAPRGPLPPGVLGVMVANGPNGLPDPARSVVLRGKVRKRIRPVSKRRQAVTAVYRREARAFVAAAVARGETCPVVAAVRELSSGRKYGHPISDRLNEVHHMCGRAGKLLLDKRWWMALSKQGHRWVHEHPAEARRRGWLAGPGEWGRQEP